MKILDFFFDAYDSLRQLIFRNSSQPGSGESGFLLRFIPVLFIVIILFTLVVGFLWNNEPDSFDPVQHASRLAGERGEDMLTGYITTATLIHTAEIMLDKRGGYLSNDMMPPGVLLDNIPNWEFGVLTQIRDLNLSLRNDFTRSSATAGRTNGVTNERFNDEMLTQANAREDKMLDDLEGRMSSSLGAPVQMRMNANIGIKSKSPMKKRIL